MDSVPIVDAHHQLDRSNARPDQLAPLLAQNGVERTVLVQAEPSLEATRTALALADGCGFAAAAAVWVDVAADGLAELLDGLAASPKLRGVCLPANIEDDNHWLTQAPVIAGLREVAKRGLSADVIAEPRQLPSVRALAEALPELDIALAHIGAPFIARGEREPWGMHMLNLAPLRNVTVKLTGLVTLDTRPWNAAHLRLFVEPIVRMFGFERMMFGSDWPAHNAAAAYAQVLGAAREAASPMTDAQHAQLFGRTAAAFYRLP